MKKIGILGLNGRPEITIGLIEQTNDCAISGIYDADTIEGISIAETTGLNYTDNPFGLIAKSDLLIVPKTDEYSYNLMVECILNSKHLLIENPENITLSEADHLSKLASEASVSVVPFISNQFNHCLIKVRSYIFNPTFVQISYSCSTSNEITTERKTGILLNIIDTSLNLAKANVKRIFANSVKIIGTQPKVLSIRLEYDNGCIANISINYTSKSDEFSISVYQQNQIVNIDMLKNSATIRTFSDNILTPEVEKITSSGDENPYSQILTYLYALETLNTQVGLMESFKNSLHLLKKIQEKIQ